MRHAASHYYKGFCVEQSIQNGVFPKCLQVFTKLGRVTGLPYLCTSKPGRTALKSFSTTLKEVPAACQSSSPLKQLL